MSYLILDLDSCYADGFYTSLDDAKRLLEYHKKERPYCVLVKGDSKMGEILNTHKYWIGYKSGDIPKHLKNKMRFMAFERAV